MKFSGWQNSSDNGAAATANMAYWLNGAFVGQNSSDYPTPWFRVADINWDSSWSYSNFLLTFLVHKTYNGRTQCGILHIDLRTNGSAGVEYASITWPMASTDIRKILQKFVLNYDSDNKICALFVKIDEPWVGYEFTLLNATNRLTRNWTLWNLYNRGLTHGGECDTLPYPNTVESIYSS